MFVCVCNGVSDKQLKACLDEGARTVGDLSMATAAGTCCGTCVATLEDMIEERWGPSDPYSAPGPVVAEHPGTHTPATAVEPVSVRNAVRPAAPDKPSAARRAPHG